MLLAATVVDSGSSVAYSADQKGKVLGICCKLTCKITR